MLPDQDPEAVQLVGLLVADQVRVTVPPVVTEGAEEVKVTTGFWTGGAQAMVLISGGLATVQGSLPRLFLTARTSHQAILLWGSNSANW